MNNQKDFMNKNAGISIIGLIILAVLVVLALNYFHLSIKITSDNSSNQSSIGEVVKNLYNTFLAKPLEDIWNNFILPFISSLKNGNYAQPGTAPQVNY